MKANRAGRERRVGVPLVEPSLGSNATRMGQLWTFSYLKRRWGKEVHLWKWVDFGGILLYPSTSINRYTKAVVGREASSEL